MLLLIAVRAEGLEPYRFSTPIGFFLRRRFEKISIGLQVPDGSTMCFLSPLEDSVRAEGLEPPTFRV